MMWKAIKDAFGFNNETVDAIPDNNKALIELRDIIKIFKTEAGEFYALKGVNVSIEQGEFAAIVGKSGSGKSTLINMLTGIDRPSQGEILINGIPIHKLSENQLAKWRGKNIGVVFQFFQLLPTLTIVDNVILPMELCNCYEPGQRRKRALELLDMVDLRQQANKLPSALSGGQQQRAAIARALANDPPIIVADEPTGNLDTATAESVFAMFIRLAREGRTIVMVTHDKDLAARAGRLIEVENGKVVS